MKKQEKLKAGHYEIHGETIAKYEFFDNGFNPYSRYLDIDKIDLILRKRIKNVITYIEVQVKYGTLYKCGPKWQKQLFDYTTWRFFKPNEFSKAQKNLFIAYVFDHPDGYKGDIFLFPVKDFSKMIKMAIDSPTKNGLKKRMYIAHSIVDNKWYLWRKYKFNNFDQKNVFDVTKYRRNFIF